MPSNRYKVATKVAALFFLALTTVSAIRRPESFPQHPQASRQLKQEQLQQRQHVATTIARTTPRGGKVDTKAAEAPPKPAIFSDAVTGTIVLTLIERVVNKIFMQKGVKFPAQLGGCGLLFAFLVVADAVVPGLGNSIFEYLTPGTTLLTKWLAVFFVPGLAMLPLAPSVGSGLEVSNRVCCCHREGQLLSFVETFDAVRLGLKFSIFAWKICIR